ncbi:hypothetical protein VCHC17A1_2254B, partial [Vibrio cholerae HC-17A1]
IRKAADNSAAFCFYARPSFRFNTLRLTPLSVTQDAMARVPYGLRDTHRL